MSNSNDFLAFAIAAGANVRTPSGWAGDAALAQGIQAGVLQSITLNTALRQGTSVAAMIAQFTADYGPGNVQDNGNIPTLEAQFKAALSSFINVYHATDIGSANAMAITVAGLTSLVASSVFVIKKSSSPNTAGVALNVNALGAITVCWADGTSLVGNDWPGNVTGIVEYDGTQFNLLSVMGPTVFRRANFGVNVAAYTAAATGTFTAPYAGWYFAELVGAGGGGAGGNGAASSGGGGGSGGYSSKWIYLTAGQTVSYTVGAGGAGGANGNPSYGSSGGTTSFGAFHQGTGGGGGANSTTTSGGGAPGQGTGGNKNLYGACGGDGNPTGPNYQGGSGGSSVFGGGGRTSTTTVASNGFAPGSGGGGVWGTLGAVGGRGADGAIFISY